MQVLSPVTAAGPSSIYTKFPSSVVLQTPEHLDEDTLDISCCQDNTTNTYHILYPHNETVQRQDLSTSNHKKSPISLYTDRAKKHTRLIYEHRRT